MTKRLSCAAVLLGAGLMSVSHAYGSLLPFQTYNGSYGLSTDGFGSTTDMGTIGAFVPKGATVTSAYLYSAYYEGPSFSPSVTLNGTAANFTSNVVNATANYLGAARADVTSIVAPVVNGGAGGQYNFNVHEVNGSEIDGEALVVVYNLPSLATSTVAILDGFSAQDGDTTHINFAQPLDPSAPGFIADLRLGDSFSCCGQASTIGINGTTITTNAGNNDDSRDGGSAQDGNLITVGGSNDPYSPMDPSYDQDHERYDLTPEIKKGDTTITVNTFNPSHDDNIFLATFDVTGDAAINAPPPPVGPPAVTPEPSSFILLGTGLAGAAGAMRRRFRS